MLSIQRRINYKNLAGIFAVALIAAASLLVASQWFAAQTVAADPPPTAEEHFTFDNATGTITAYSALGPKEVVVPSQIGGVDVEHITGTYDIDGYLETAAFSGLAINSIILPSSLTTIGPLVLSDNNLTEISIPNSVTTIGSNAFDDNPLQTINIGNSDYIGAPQLDIGSSLFVNIPTLQSVTLGNNVRNVWQSAFSGSPITSLDLGESVQVISQQAFSGNNLTELFIPNSVQELSSGSFSNSNNLTNLVVGDDSFVGEPHLVMTVMFNGNSAPSLASVVFGGSIHTIDASFIGSSALTSLDLGGSVRVITNGSFDSTSIEELFVPNSVEVFNYSVFSNSSSLREVVFGTLDYSGVAKIELTSTGLSSNLSSLESVKVLSNVSRVSSGIFAYAPNLSYVEIRGGVELIDNGAFSYNPSLQTVIIGNDVPAVITAGAFQNVSALTTLNLGSSVKSISGGAFRENALTSLRIPASVTEVSGGAFAGSTELQELIIEGDTQIVGGAFLGFNPSAIRQIFINGDAVFDDYTEEALTETVASTGEYIRIYAPETSSWYNAPDLEAVYIVNPAEINLSYIDEDSNSLAPNYYTVGGDLENYTVESNPTADFSVYYRASDEVELEPISISGYNTPDQQGFVLGAGLNNLAYVYETVLGSSVDDQTGLPNSGQLALTGIITIIALAAVGGGIYLRLKKV